MAYPPALQVRPVTFGPLKDFEGNPIQDDTIEVRAERSFWFAGDTYLASPIKANLVNGYATIPLPCTDQPGMTDGTASGDEVTGWTYTVQWPQLDPGMDQPEDVTFTVLTTDAEKAVQPQGLSLLRTAGLVDLVPGSLAAVQALTAQAQAAAVAAYNAEIAAGGSASSASAAALSALTYSQSALQAALDANGRVQVWPNDPQGILAGGRPYFLGGIVTVTPGGPQGPTTIKWLQVIERPDIINSIASGEFVPVETADARLSNARTPTAHTHVIASITDLQPVLDQIDADKADREATANALDDKAPLDGAVFETPAKGPTPVDDDDYTTKAWVIALVGYDDDGDTPHAGIDTPGTIMLPGGIPGELGGTYDHPAVTGWNTKVDISQYSVDMSLKASTAALTTGLSGKEPLITPPSAPTTKYLRGDKTFQVLDKTAVGLANVDNTTDANKPVSTPQAAAIATARKAVEGGSSAITAQFTVPNGATTLTVLQAWWDTSVVVQLSTANIGTVTVQPPLDPTRTHSIMIVFRQPTTGAARTVSGWNIKWLAGGSEPVVTPTLAAEDRIAVNFDAGGTWGSLVGQAFA